MQEIPIVLIGHKDHGKSTLIGRLILDTGSIKESRVKEVQEVDEAAGQKFELAHLVDSFREEREREMTMDTTRAVLKGKERIYQLIDVPGHAELIANMLTGASNAEAALLVVSMKEGVKEQTRQHLEVAWLLGIRQLGVAVNKIDTVGYQQAPFEELKEKVGRILNEIGYVSEKIHFFPISAREGDNVVTKSDKMNWYQGRTVMDYLEFKEITMPKIFDDLSYTTLSIQACYADKEKAMLVGWIDGGNLKVGEEISFANNKKFKIIKIKDSEELNQKELKAGQSFAVEISGVPTAFNLRGTAIIGSVPKINVLSGEIFWIEKPTSKDNLILERGVDRVEGVLLEPDLESFNSGEKTHYKFLPQENIFKTFLNKIILKEKGKIIAVGNIQ